MIETSDFWLYDDEDDEDDFGCPDDCWLCVGDDEEDEE